MFVKIRIGQYGEVEKTPDRSSALPLENILVVPSQILARRAFMKPATWRCWVDRVSACVPDFPAAGKRMMRIRDQFELHSRIHAVYVERYKKIHLNMSDSEEPLYQAMR
jgi:hypothetical protein